MGHTLSFLPSDKNISPVTTEALAFPSETIDRRSRWLAKPSVLDHPLSSAPPPQPPCWLPFPATPGALHHEQKHGRWRFHSRLMPRETDNGAGTKPVYFLLVVTRIKRKARTAHDQHIGISHGRGEILLPGSPRLGKLRGAKHGASVDEEGERDHQARGGTGIPRPVRLATG